MHTQSHRLLPWTSAGLAALGVGLLVTLAVSMYNYGVYVDEHALGGEIRPIEIILFLSGAGAVIAAMVLFVIWQRRSA